MVFLSLCLSRLWEPSPPWCPQNAVIIPCEEKALKGRRCVSLCSFLGLCPRASEVRSNFQWHSKPVRAPVSPAWAAVWRITIVIADRRPTSQWVKRWERNSSGNGRKSGADTERDGARGWRRTTRWWEALSHQPAPWPLSLLSLTLFLVLCLSLTLTLPLSVRRSFTLLSSLSLHNLSLPAAIPTTFSGVTQQKEEGSSLKVAGAVIWVSSQVRTLVLILLPPPPHPGRPLVQRGKSSTQKHLNFWVYFAIKRNPRDESFIYFSPFLRITSRKTGWWYFKTENVFYCEILSKQSNPLQPFK